MPLSLLLIYYCKKHSHCSGHKLSKDDLRKMIGQGYDGAAIFAGKISGVHKGIQTPSAHAIYIYCSCHRLQLTSILTAASVKEIRMFLEP